MAPKGRKQAGDAASDDDFLDELPQQSTMNKSIFKYGVPLNILLAGVIAYTQFMRKPASVLTVLTEDTFGSFVDKHPEGVLVDFHMPGCVHCETLAPEFEAAARTLGAKKPAADAEGAGGPVMLASLDGEAQPAIAKKYDMKRYPTVLWFKKGQNVQELPPMSRTHDKIVEFVEWVQQPAIVEFPSRQDFKEAVQQLRESMHPTSPPVVVAFAGPGNEGLYDALERSAEQYRGKLIFLYVHEDKAAPAAVEGVAELETLPSALRSYGSNAEADVEFTGSPSDPALVLRWVEGLLTVHKDVVKAVKAAEKAP